MNPEKALERLLDCKSQYLEIKDKLDVSVFDKKFEQVRK